MAQKPFQTRDHGLWDELKRTIAPLKHRGSKPAKLVVAKTHSAAGHTLAGFSHHAPHHAAVDPLRGKTPPALATFDRRTAQKLSRGQTEPEARIDLHGEGIETARIKLHHFLVRQRRMGARLVLVITGKGASPFARHTLHGFSHFHTPEREGRLRREMPIWLQEHGFREHVVGFQPAHPRHGGGGAFYLRLRRNADQ